MNPTDPAFPVPETQHHIANGAGMDLRTYMATAFVAGRVAHDGGTLPSSEAVVDHYVKLADALIERLNAK